MDEKKLVAHKLSSTTYANMLSLPFIYFKIVAAHTWLRICC